jgi:SAM-dependent methyltransferase
MVSSDHFRSARVILASDVTKLHNGQMRERRVEPEWLDELPASDGHAVRSRGDLLRLNSIMGHPRLVAAALRKCTFQNWGRRVLDLGSGDGTFLLKVATRLGTTNSIDAVAIDRQPLIARRTQERFSCLGWNLEERTGDVFNVLQGLPKAQGTAAIANLFLHHFGDKLLRELFALVAERADVLVAAEPRRTPFALAASRLVGFIGCNAVTRHDAVASVRAGFTDLELTSLWGRSNAWIVEESRAEWFSHLLVCRRKRA